MSLENEVKTAMQAAIDHFKKDLKSLRTGRANASILDHVTVEVYGSQLALKNIANITVPEPRQIVITPYDSSNVPSIVKGIESAKISLQAYADGNVVRIIIPPMDEASRKAIVKQCSKKAEDAKIAIRECRRKYNDLSRKKKSEGEFTEDQEKRLEKNIQEFTDKFCKEIEVVCKAKEKEILEI
jgi:ribosome recycling factor